MIAASAFRQIIIFLKCAEHDREDREVVLLTRRSDGQRVDIPFVIRTVTI